MNWQLNRCLSEFSTVEIGGPIRYFAEIKTAEEMEEAFVFSFKQNLDFFILGKGSNCLFNDRGFDGVVLLNRIATCSWDHERVTVGAGYNFSLLGIQSAKRGFSGLEFAAGIPASVGGAVFMNAGANGQETKDFLQSVCYLDSKGKTKEFQKEELEFRYRFSSFQKMKGAILSATFQLKPLPTARKEQLIIIEKRVQTQPLKEKSIGCIFRNPTSSLSAGSLIDRCGLKKLSVGGAAVSSVHANFIINEGSATAKNVQELIHQIQERVYAATQVQLEPEIRIL